MKPAFALNLSHDGISLLHRTARGWLCVGEARLDAADLGAELAYLRRTALGLSPQGFATKLILPNSQLLYLTLDAPGPDAATRRKQIARALEGRTPYAVPDLAYDWSGTGTEVQVAVVARETLHEAEEFALQHRLNPVAFVAIPEPGDFAGEPFFGQAAAARSFIPEGERLIRDQDPVRITGMLDSAAVTAAAEAGPDEAEDPASDWSDGAQLEEVLAPEPEAAAPAAPDFVVEATEPGPGVPEAEPEPAAATGEIPDHPAEPEYDPAAIAATLEQPDVPEAADSGLLSPGIAEAAFVDLDADDADIREPAAEPEPADVAQTGQDDLADVEAGFVDIDLPEDDLPAASTAPDGEPEADAAEAYSTGHLRDDAEPAPAFVAEFGPEDAPQPTVEAVAAFSRAERQRRRAETGGADHLTDPATDATWPRDGAAVVTAASLPAGEGLARPQSEGGARRLSLQGESRTGAGPARERGPIITAPSLPPAERPEPRPRSKPQPGYFQIAAKAAATEAAGSAKRIARKIIERGAAAAQPAADIRPATERPAAERHAPDSRGTPTRRAATAGAAPATTVFGARRKGDPAVGGKPRYLGLALTGGLVALMAIVTLWSVVLQPDDPTATIPTDTLAEATPPAAAPPETAAPAGMTLPPVEEATAAPEPTAAPVSEPAAPTAAPADAPAVLPAEAAAQDTALPPAAVPAETEPPQPDLPVPAVTADVAPPVENPTPDAFDGLAMRRSDQPDLQRSPGPLAGAEGVTGADTLPAPPQPPLPFGTTYDYDENGFIRATPDGALTPEGALVIAGAPKVLPPPRPGSAVPEPLAAPATEPVAEPVVPAAAAPEAAAPPAPAQEALPPPNPALEGKRPMARPADLKVPQDQTGLNAPDAPTIANLPPANPALARRKPQPRPAEIAALGQASAAARAAEEAAKASFEAALASATASAVATSRRPEQRPRSFATGIEAAVAAAVAAPPAAAPAAAAAPPPAPAPAPTPAPAPKAAAPAPAAKPAPAVKAAPAPKATASADPEEIDEPEPTSAAPKIPTSASVAKQATIRNALDLSEINLIGVYGSSSNRRALVRLSNGRYLRVQVGDRLDGGKVSAIGESQLSYVKGGRTVVLKMIQES